jgi:hypothetical protein
MSCDNRYNTLVDRYVKSTLDGKELDELGAHLKQCSDCRYELAAQLWLEKELTNSLGQVLPSFDHPTPRGLTQYVNKNSLLHRNEYARIDQHVTSCSTCQGRIKIIEQVDMAFSESFSSESRNADNEILITKKKATHWTRWATAAAAIILISYPTYLGMRELLQPSRSTSAELAKATQALTARPVLLKQIGERNVGEVDTSLITISENDTYIGFVVLVPKRQSMEYAYDLSMVDSSGSVIESTANVRAFDAEGRLVVILKSESLRAGQFSIVVTERKQGDPAYSVAFRYPFQISTR